MSLFQRNKSLLNGVSRIYQRNMSATSLKADTDDDSEVFVSRNKSGLLTQHRNMLHNRTPYIEPSSWIHLTEKYQRKIFGRYGSKSGVDPRICFNAKSSKSYDYYEKLSENEKLQTMINKYKLQEKLKAEEILKREEEISKKLEKLNQWKQDLNAKIHKKEAEAIAAKEKKERLIEEVRRHFGYKVDPKDERFKEMLEQKEKEDKKKQKEEKRKLKEEKLMSKLIEKTAP